MAKNKLEDLYDILFMTIEAVKDPDKPMELDRARTVKGLADSIINTGKLEVQYMEVTGQQRGSQFLPPPEGRTALPHATTGKRLNGAS